MEVTEGEEFPQNNTPLIRKMKIPILGETKAVTHLKDKDGNEISLKIESGYYWVPDIASKHSLEFSLMKQFIKTSNSKKATIREYHVWKNGLKNDLKVIEDDIVDAKKQILEVKKYATKIPKFKKFQAKHGLFSSKSYFIYTVATQGDTGDIWAQHKFRISDILGEQQDWITGLEKRKKHIQIYMDSIVQED